MSKNTRIGHVLAILLATATTAMADSAPAKAPRLIVQITVDQFRGDLPTRYRDRLGEGGFRYLLEHGIHYANAHYRHATTETIVGHATLATGAHPATHGMVANVWFDRELDRLVYNIEDSRYLLLTAGADIDSATEIDPTQKKARSEGRSPAAIQVSTFSDELASLTGGRAKVFAVSVKDRGAVFDRRARRQGLLPALRLPRPRTRRRARPRPGRGGARGRRRAHEA